MPRFLTIALQLSVAAVLASACGGPASPSSTSLSTGQWSGTTAQGAPITFTVSPDEILTTLTIGHRFNGCTGSQTFSNLNVPTKPDIICVPGPCTGTTASFREFAYVSGDRTGTEPSTGVIGLFLPGNQASGQANFQNFPGCGTAAGVAWTATRR